MSGEIVLGVTSGTRNGKPIVITQPKRCDGVTTGQYYTGLVSGTRDGKPVVGISTQRCGDGGILVNGQTYLGLVSGTRDGKPILVVPCGNCTGFSACECDICCTLEGTIQLPSIADPAVWSDPIDITLTCGESFTVWNGSYSCLSDTVEDDTTTVDMGVTTYSGKSGTVVMDWPGYPGQSTDFVTEVWKSNEVTYNGTTYRVIFIATAFTYTPDIEHHQCSFAMVVQNLTENGWCNYFIANGLIHYYGAGEFPSSDLITVVSDENPGCPEGYHENGGENYCAMAYDGTFYWVTEDGESNLICPIVVDLEAIIPTFLTKLAKIQLYDLC